jgi:hypothetical protein
VKVLLPLSASERGLGGEVVLWKTRRAPGAHALLEVERFRD